MHQNDGVLSYSIALFMKINNTLFKVLFLNEHIEHRYTRPSNRSSMV